MGCEMEEPSCSAKGHQSQSSEQMTCEIEQVEGEKEALNSQAAEQAQLEMQKETGMGVEPCVEEECLTEAAEQKMYEEGKNMCENESPQMQTAKQMAREEAQHTRSSQTNRAKESSLAEQDVCDIELESNEGVSSDEEFVPESDPESDSDFDAEKPVAKASDTSKDVEEEIMPPNQKNHLVTQAAKENFCFVCGKASSKIARHLKVHRKDNFEIDSAFKLRKSSKERKRILEVLRNRGNYQHNAKVCRNRSGLIKVNRTPREKFEYYMYCKGLYMRKELWRHVRRCTSNPERDAVKGAKARVLGLAAMAQCPHLQHVSDDVKKILCDMHQDEVAQGVRNDEYVLGLAQYVIDKKSNSKERHEFVGHSLRCIGKFLNILHKKTSIRNLAEAIKPSRFPEVTEAVKELAEYNMETNSFAIPSLARSVGLTLRKFCILTAEKAFAVKDKTLIESTGRFFTLFDDARSQFALGAKKPHPAFIKPPLLPFVKDVRLFHCYLEKEMQCTVQELREKPSAQSYANLSKVMLAQILMFNRRLGEISNLTIKVFQERDKEQVSDTSDELTEFEKELFKDHCKLHVMQKIGSQATIILTPDMVSALMLLIEKRKQCGVYDGNRFVFGRIKGFGYYRGENALRICANECCAMNPDQLISTEFSKHIATLTQVLSLKNHELGILAKFIGYDISARKEYYRQPEATARLAKICKLILAIEKGSTSDLLGESLDDVVLSDEINESDTEAEDFEDEELVILKRSILSKSHKKDSGSTAKEGVEESNKQVAEEWEVLEQPKRLRKRKPWTREESMAVVKHFKNHIYYGKLARVRECQRCQVLEHPALDGRTTQNIRDFVRNMGKSYKKRMEARTHIGTCPVAIKLIKHMDPPIQASSPNSVPSPQKVNSPSSGLSPKVTAVQPPEAATSSNVE
ncbi:uncharacterized protein LOC113572144 isoform X2 [Electrophorus electricus]|nr:uncharacterized protein LOC113572144 isoform X2 [Electrophorus electricus]